MTETRPTVAEQIDALQAEAESCNRVAPLARVLSAALDLLREIDAARPPPGTLTPAELEQALGGAAFLASLGRMLGEVHAAREADVDRVVAHVMAAARAPRTGDAP